MQTGHSTARQAAEIAREAEVRMLALTHISTRYAGGEIRDEARAIFERTEVPRDFDSIEIPFPEKGEPELHRFDAEQARAGAARERAAAGMSEQAQT
jgi:ribonuclease Z